jgi:DNA-binding transcriptional ArsR family regulator
MPGDANIAAFASLLADPTRVSMLVALADERALPAGDLARQARVSASTASAHLAKLVESGLLVVEKQGRHRYYRLADPAIEQALETLAGFAPAAPVHSLLESETAKAIRTARMCYGHLGGALAVALADSLTNREFIVDSDAGYFVTGAGRRWPALALRFWRRWTAPQAPGAAGCAASHRLERAPSPYRGVNGDGARQAHARSKVDQARARQSRRTYY